MRYTLTVLLGHRSCDKPGVSCRDLARNNVRRLTGFWAQMSAIPHQPTRIRSLLLCAAHAAARGQRNGAGYRKRQPPDAPERNSVTAAEFTRRGGRARVWGIAATIRNACRFPCFGVSGRSIAPTVAYTIIDSINADTWELRVGAGNAGILSVDYRAQLLAIARNMQRERDRKGSRPDGTADPAHTDDDPRNRPAAHSTYAQAALRGVRRVLAGRVGHAAASSLAKNPYHGRPVASANLWAILGPGFLRPVMRSCA